MTARAREPRVLHAATRAGPRTSSASTSTATSRSRSSTCSPAQRTPGRVNTQEKVFSTFKHLQLGLNDEGRFAPYLVGFCTFCTAYDATGALVVDQQMPKTAAGLSGMTMIHHQPHTTQTRARSCVECHRSGAAWGLGTGSFDLGRGLVAVATPGGRRPDRGGPQERRAERRARRGAARARPATSRSSTTRSTGSPKRSTPRPRPGIAVDRRREPGVPRGAAPDPDRRRRRGSRRDRPHISTPRRAGTASSSST